MVNKYHVARKLLLSPITFLLLSLTACSYVTPYHPPVQQGNVIDEKEMSQLHMGMTHEQVATVLGSPLMDAFIADPNDWHYIYSVKKHREPVQKKYLTLVFVGDRLVSIKR